MGMNTARMVTVTMKHVMIGLTLTDVTGKGYSKKPYTIVNTHTLTHSKHTMA